MNQDILPQSSTHAFDVGAILREAAVVQEAAHRLADRFYVLGDRDLTLEEVEASYIQFMMRKTGGNRAEAARRLGVDVKTLARKGF